MGKCTEYTARQWWPDGRRTERGFCEVITKEHSVKRTSQRDEYHCTHKCQDGLAICCGCEKLFDMPEISESVINELGGMFDEKA